MNYWNMQLHPNDLGWTKEKELLEKHHLIGLGDWEEAAGQQPNFENTMAIGDYVLIKHGGDIIALTRIIGNYFYDENTDDLRWFQRCRQVEVLDWYKKEYDFKVSSRKALERYNENNNTEQLQSIKKWINMINIKTFIKENKDLLIANHNLILTGAPGTGKTYLAKQIAQQMIFGEIKDDMTQDEERQFNEQCGFVQFHPSYDYTDFVEGLRPQDDNNNVGFGREDGVFKEFCNRALKCYGGVSQLPNFDDIYDSFIEDILNDPSFELETEKQKRPFKIEVNRNKNLNVIPQTNINRTYKPPIKKEVLRDYLESGRIVDWKSYVPIIGEYIRKNYLNEENQSKRVDNNAKFVFIIDEINRGEISKIFGELFFSIDPGYRGKDGKVRTQYANMQVVANIFDQELNITNSNDYGHFFVPENVYIIGTMNDIDRSVESMDFAFRRRFAFKEITAEESKQMLDSENAWGKDENGNLRKPDQVDIDTIKSKMDAINNVIWHKEKEEEKDEDKSIEGLSSAYHIGASYFLKLVNYKNADGSYDYDQLWENHLEGLLLEYMRGMADVQKKIKKLANAYGYSKMNKYE